MFYITKKQAIWQLVKGDVDSQIDMMKKMSELSKLSRNQNSYTLFKGVGGINSL